MDYTEKDYFMVGKLLFLNITEVFAPGWSTISQNCFPELLIPVLSLEPIPSCSFPSLSLLQNL